MEILSRLMSNLYSCFKQDFGSSIELYILLFNERIHECSYQGRVTINLKSNEFKISYEMNMQIS